MADLDGYRIEPIMAFGDPFTYKRLTEIWWEIIEGGDYSLYVYWRGGSTIKEVLAASWISQGYLPLNNPARAVLTLKDAPSALYHQIKWGTDKDSEKFCISRIKFKGFFGEKA